MADFFKFFFPTIIEKSYKQTWNDNDDLKFFKFISESSYIVDYAVKENLIIDDCVCHQCGKSKWSFKMIKNILQDIFCGMI
jgi:hypothetical protein